MRYAPGNRLPRHRHEHGYAALVVAGSYQEAGDAGRFRTEPGTLVVHGRFEAHQNHFSSSGAQVLDLPLKGCPGALFGCVADADEIVRLAERDLEAAAHLALASLKPGPEMMADWPDLLAAELRSGKVFDLRGWAMRIGIAPSSLSRGFAQAYGVSPKRYRADGRARAAYSALSGRMDSLASLAIDLEFADQAHMSREIRSLSGFTPSQIRRAARSR
ncbi:MAG: helix-turn-helix transcriptional regulator [Sphingomonas sp.]|uniref:helix-turn-helix domain-containing protein n=1 Tax=Sphingomonas sp. TaxID=28214 RepID=UPI0018492893|nr:AraC family transcriptional regulator [Sphingomonas sp.]MBA3668268.1 helix-turn-helix transcriptional regulator [Sphingomonas sp.]